MIRFTSLILVLLSLIGCGGGDSDSEKLPHPLANVAPISDAGDDQTVDENTEVILSGSGTDTDGTIAQYSWLQTAGTNVTITDADSASASFTAPNIDSDETLTFELTVTDDDGVDHRDNVNVTVVAGYKSIGAWYSQSNNLHLMINQSELHLYYYHSDYQCFHKQQFTLTEHTEQSLSFFDFLYNRQQQVDYQVTDGTMLIGDISLASEEQTSLPYGPNLCQREDINGTIEVLLSFSQLPEEITNPGLSDGYALYNLELDFDINEDGQMDGGDVSFIINVGAGDVAQQESLKFDSLYSWVRFRFSPTVSRREINLEYSINGGTILLHVPLTNHVAFSKISEKTPLAVSSYITHLADIGAIGATSSDRLPDTGFSLIDNANMHYDEQGDVYGGGSPLVDILSVQVNVIN